MDWKIYCIVTFLPEISDRCHLFSYIQFILYLNIGFAVNRILLDLHNFIFILFVLLIHWHSGFVPISIHNSWGSWIHDICESEKTRSTIIHARHLSTDWGTRSIFLCKYRPQKSSFIYRDTLQYFFLLFKNSIESGINQKRLLKIRSFLPLIFVCSQSLHRHFSPQHGILFRINVPFEKFVTCEYNFCSKIDGTFFRNRRYQSLRKMRKINWVQVNVFNSFSATLTEWTRIFFSENLSVDPVCRHSGETMIFRKEEPKSRYTWLVG